jgi:putative ABC transport system permease protein
MIKSYFILGIRNILKNRIISLFNVFGLAIAIGCAIVIFVFIEYNFNVDRFHEHAHRIYMVTHVRQDNGLTYGTSPQLLAELIKEEGKSVEDVVRCQTRKVTVIAESQEPFYELVSFVDKQYLGMFSFDLSAGQASALKDPSKVIISADVAKKYFGNSNPLGESFELVMSDGRKISVSVGGVAAEFPAKRSFDFSFLINRDVIVVPEAENQWEAFVDATFVKVSEGGEIKSIKEILEKFRQQYNLKNPEQEIGAFGVEPLPTLAQESYRIRNAMIRGYGPPSGKIAFSVIGLLLVTLACLNYVNTATALGVGRLKEIGIRKVVGGGRRSIILQFLTENVIINLIALFVGFLLCTFVLLPGFDSLFQIGLTLEPANGSLWLFLTVMLIITSILSGAYPAFYISKYKPVSILSGNSKIGSKSIFSKVLLSFQFLLSFIYIVASLLFIANESYQRDKDWGYESENLLVVRPENRSAYLSMKNALSEKPYVSQIAGAHEHIGSNYREAVLKADTISMTVHQFSVDSLYLDAMQVRMLEGNSFSGRFGSDKGGIIINENLAKHLGSETVIGKTIKLDDKTFHIVGVVHDFRYGSPQRKIEPVVIQLSQEDTYPFLVIRAVEGQTEKLTDEMKEIWKSASPDIPYNGFHQEEVLERYFVLMSGHSKVMVFSAVLAVSLACLGLFGLVYLHVIARMKDYSIMKILGINTFSLSRQVAKKFIMFLIIAIVLGFPSSIFLSRLLFKIVYTDYISITLLYPFIGAILLIMISLGTLALVIVKLMRNNPLDTLRS